MVIVNILIGEDGRSKGKTSVADSSRSGSGQYDYSRNFGAINHLSSSFTTDEVYVDATSEKELKKFNEAIECYSRSIALSPTAVAHANRAMAYLKIKSQVFPVRYQAEDDCTEALNLDDHYIKAYSRRATARKELGKLKESIEDSGFALKLEPNNQEIKKQHAEVKSLYEKARDSPIKSIWHSQKLLTRSTKRGRSEASVNGHAVHQVLNATQRTGVSASKKDNTKENDGNYLVRNHCMNKGTGAGSKSDGQVGNDSPANATPNSNVESVQKNNRTRRQELKTSVIELASQAASRAMAEAAKNITHPNSAYQFEVTSPSALPQIFKIALSVPILIDIIKRVASFSCKWSSSVHVWVCVWVNLSCNSLLVCSSDSDDMDLAVKYVENLTKVPRFGVLVMCLSSTDMCGI
uniref:RNA-polymerase II-associated protein 3-like C-terminal domain-containing protein n=1 Tax=Salix viminalis TaxID=40686 RepID=A0A6N2L2L7_SALVM